MAKTVLATYEGKGILRIEEGLDLRPNTKVKVTIHQDDTDEGDLLQVIISESRATGIRDWARHHDHYIYGVPKGNK